jgi:O-antigen/teichoic acid export membrane protein
VCRPRAKRNNAATVSAMNTAPAASLGRLLSGSAMIFACRLCGAALTFLLQIALARWLGAAELGIYVLAFSWCILLSTLSHLGLMQASMRFIGEALAAERPGRARGFAAGAATLVGIASLGIAATFAVAVWLLRERLPAADPLPFLIAAATVPVYALLNLQAGISNAFAWLRLAFVPANVARPLLTVLLVGACWYGLGTLSAGGVMLIQWHSFVVVATVVLTLFVQRLRRATGAHAQERHQSLWVRTALPLLVANLFANYFPEITMIMLGLYLPAEEIAVFNAAFRVAMLIAFGVIAVDAITMPSSAQLHAGGRHAELQATIARASQLRFWASVVGAGVFALFGQQILALFGSEFVAGYPALMILVLAQLLRAGFGPSAELLAISGHQNRCIKVFASSLLVLCVLLAGLVPRWGVNGAAAAVTLTMLFWNLWLNSLVRRLLNIRPDAPAGLRLLLGGR